MKPTHCFIGILLVASLKAEPAPREAPLVLDADVRSAAAAVSVAKIDYLVPGDGTAAEIALATDFFNRPELRADLPVTTANWDTQWQSFSDALVAKAKAQNLESTRLEACLRALNRGRNRQTLLSPHRERKIFPDHTPAAQIKAFEQEAEKNYHLALQERNEHPERWYDNSFAIVPVAAYAARHAQGDCWIVVCKWETGSKEPRPLVHVKVWAFDTKSTAVVGYATCD